MQYFQSNEYFTSLRATLFHYKEPNYIQGEKKKKVEGKKAKEEKTFEIPADLDEALAFKRDFSRSFPSTFDSEFVEKVWPEFWERQGFAHMTADEAKKVGPERKFVIILPPPNVTGSLHIGHALTAAVQDCMVRRKRMQGFTVCYLPGNDHAGIATQSVVEKMLAKEGLDKHTLGKTEFLKRVWEWKEQYGSRINMQLRRLGSFLDWKRFSFTMDEVRSKAVIEAFVRLDEKGLIYRDNRLVNWDCRLRTAVSDIEVDDLPLDGPTLLTVPGYTEEVRFGELVKFAYKLEDGEGEIVVATTRIETMLGDVAVAVHSTDPRYSGLIGRWLKHPFVDRRLKIIADDELVDPAFGTGAVKITPAHDPNDFACGRRNGLDFISILDDEGRVTASCGKFAGMLRYVARKELMAALESEGLLRGTLPNPMTLKVSSKSGDIIEPRLKPQWYVRCGEVSRVMAEKVASGELRLIPDQEKKKWASWMNGALDWCISRQLWWGHQIPAYRIEAEGAPVEDVPDAWVIARSEEEALELARKKYPGVEKISLKRDEDVLDTWFSSGLLPFSNFGWPDQTADLEAFYPNSVLETGNDILFFWVAKMVMFGLWLTDSLPFHTVFLHSLVRDKDGEKMSKSKGNVIDPLEVIDGCALSVLEQKLLESTLPKKEIEKAVASRREQFPEGIPRCGADALRYALLGQMSEKDINLSLTDIVNCRKFANKIWNSYFRAVTFLPADFKFTGLQPDLPPADQWLLMKLRRTNTKVNAFFENYRFALGAKKLMKFWYCFCDNYLEYFKSAPVQRFDVLFFALENFLKLLHPVMPFLTEELYQKLPAFEGKKESIVLASYPEDFVSEEAQASLFKDVLKIADKTKALGLANLNFSIVVSAEDPNDPALEVVKQNSKFLIFLTKASEVQILPKEEVPKGLSRVARPGLSLVIKSNEANFKDKLFSMESEVKKLTQFIAALEEKQNAADYKVKAKPEVQAKDTEKIAAYKIDLESKEETLKILKELA